MRKIVTCSLMALGLSLGAPVMAQDTGVGEAGPGSANDNVTVDDTANDFLDFLSNNANGNNRGNIDGSNLNSSFGSNYDSMVGSNAIIATQELKAININRELDEVVDLDGEDGSETPVGYNSGSNYVRGNAFAAFAGINNAAWNTGINSNAQAATNIAAQGNVNFGVSGSAASGGGTGGGD